MLIQITNPVTNRKIFANILWFYNSQTGLTVKLYMWIVNIMTVFNIVSTYYNPKVLVF